ncbi:MAG: hypothetical protein KatS3mg104_3179 [Phycisphaerae bacterium]|nr:MAG: hypothetical protein KatS3mg104_3179 [Phycisphaerae bacterium]
MKRKVFNFAAIAAMSAMPVVLNAEETIGEKVGQAVDNVADAVTPDRKHNDVSQAPRLPQGIIAKENDDVQDVRESLITIVNRTLTQGRLDGAISYLANQDRDRVKEQLEKTDPDYENALDQQITTFRAIFKEKYGEDFELKSGMLNDVTFVQQGEVSDAVAAKMHWPLPLRGEEKETRPASDRPMNDDPKLENGRDVAVVKMSDLQQGNITLSLQYELPNYWVLDVPNSINGQAIVSYQQKVLQKLIDNKDNWPRTKEEAYRQIAASIIKAYYPGLDDGKMADSPGE